MHVVKCSRITSKGRRQTNWRIEIVLWCFDVLKYWWDLYERALATRSIQREVEDIVLLVTSMAGLLRRLVVSNEDGSLEKVTYCCRTQINSPGANVVDLLIHVLENGIDMVHEGVL